MCSTSMPRCSSCPRSASVWYGDRTRPTLTERRGCWPMQADEQSIHCWSPVGLAQRIALDFSESHSCDYNAYAAVMRLLLLRLRIQTEQARLAVDQHIVATLGKRVFGSAACFLLSSATYVHVHVHTNKGTSRQGCCLERTLTLADLRYGSQHLPDSQCTASTIEWRTEVYLLKCPFTQPLSACESRSDNAAGSRTLQDGCMAIM